MSTTVKKTAKPEPTGRHVRFQKDLLKWIDQYSREHGFGSDAELIRHAVRELKRRTEENSRTATA